MATLLNATGDTLTTMLIACFVERKTGHKHRKLHQGKRKMERSALSKFTFKPYCSAV